MRMRVILINQFYPPAAAPTARFLRHLALALAGRSHQVTVLASAGKYGINSAEDEASKSSGVKVIHLGKARKHRNSVLSKLADYARFYLEAARCLSSMTPAADVVVCMTTPPFIGLVPERMRRKRGIPFVLWCMDLYPEALAAHGLIGKRNILYRLLDRLAAKERQHASAVISIAPDMTEMLRRDPDVQVKEIPVWSALDNTPGGADEARRLRSALGWSQDQIILLYCGNMGRAHRAEEFAGLAREIKRRKYPVRVVMCGDGANRKSWEAMYAELFEFIPLTDGFSLEAHLLAADVHLVSQQPEWTGVLAPSKFQVACGLGRPVIFAGAGDCALGRWLAEMDGGWILEPADVSAIGRVADELIDPAVRSQKADGVRSLSCHLFDRDANVLALVDIIEHAVTSHT